MIDLFCLFKARQKYHTKTINAENSILFAVSLVNKNQKF